MSKQRKALEMALEALQWNWGGEPLPTLELEAMEAIKEALADDEPDMRHPKIQSLIGAKARLNIELQLVEQLIDDPYFETTASDMEYWNALHDKLHKVLTEDDRLNTFYKCLEKLRDVRDIQGQKGNWDYDEYMHGMFNGLELAVSIFEDKDPKYRSAPSKREHNCLLNNMPDGTCGVCGNVISSKNS